jgi:hypothetical protein
MYDIPTGFFIVQNDDSPIFLRTTVCFKTITSNYHFICRENCRKRLTNYRHFPESAGNVSCVLILCVYNIHVTPSIVLHLSTENLLLYFMLVPMIFSNFVNHSRLTG